MKKPKSAVRERTSSVAELAAFAGVHRATVYEWQKIAGYPIGSDGTVCKWDLCVWFEKRSMGESVASGDDEMNAIEGSYWLEQFRKFRAGEAELNLLERRKQLVSRDHMHAFIMRVASKFRTWLDRLQRKHGEEFYQAGINVLADIESETVREFGPDGEPLGAEG